MKYRGLGGTGLNVSEIGFGGWGIGGNISGSIAYGATDDGESKRALRRAFELGVNFYDTADFYGFGHSEEIIGEALGEFRSQVIIASKVGLLDRDGHYDFSAAHIRRSLEESLKRLRTDYLDLYQLHSPSLDSLEANDEWRTTLETLKREGKVRALGISVRSPDDGLTAIKKFGFDCVQVNFNLVDQRAVENNLFAQCEKNNIGVIVRTPLCFGFLTGDYSAETEYDSSDHRVQWSLEQRKRWAEAHELFTSVIKRSDLRSPVQLALRFCLSFKSVSTVIPGMITTAHVEENVPASLLGPLSERELLATQKIYKENSFFYG